MANTLFAEKNRAAWLGVRPGVYGEQLVKDIEAVAIDTVVYTVPVGKMLLMFVSWIHCFNSTAAGRAELIVRNDLGARQYSIGNAGNQSNIGSSQYSSTARYLPLEIPAGYDIQINIVAGTPGISAGIEGLLINPLENT